jgi:hypothetical protein
MVTLNTDTLRRALDITIEIERLQKELATLLGPGVSLSNATAPAAAAPRRGRKPGRAPKAPAAPKTGRTSPFKGRKRPASPSGPLGPAVIKVMQRAAGPLNVDAVLQGLSEDNYIWNVTDAKKNLAARIYKMAGVKQVGRGLFDLAERFPQV